MRFDPSRHSLTEVQAARQFYDATRQLGAFESVLSLLLGSYDEASQVTMDLIWALNDSLPIASGPRVPAVAQRLQSRLGRRFTMAVTSLMQDYGITLTPAVTLIRDLSGHVLVRGEHPQSATIEDLLNQSGLLSEAIGLLIEARRALTPAEEMADLPSLMLIDQGEGVVIVGSRVPAPASDTVSQAEQVTAG
jgi:hypothetical protein